MIKRILLLSVLISLGLSSTIAQETEEKKYGITFSGFVKNDFFWDSRQTVSAREGHFLLWPAGESLDDNLLDINAQPNLNMLAIQSRLKGTITGPDAFGAKTSGVLEVDFFAQANDNINLVRMRHAFLKLSWTNTDLLAGQFWNPMFVTGCFPGTVSFNTGTPIQSFARNPQIRVTHRIGALQLIGAVQSQRDFSTRGPDPADNTKTLVSSQFLRNSSIPDMHFQVHYGTENLLAGAGVAYKIVTPRLSSTGNLGQTVKVNESLAGVTAIGFMKYTAEAVTLKLWGRYGENIADQLSTSGFAVKSVVDPTTGEQSYTPLTNASAWGEVHTNGKKVQVGVFGGYTQNLGTKESRDDATYSVYGLGTNVQSLLRISPRIVFISGKSKIGVEMEYDVAAFGSNYDLNYLPASTTSVSNLRLLLSAIYNF